MHLLIDIGGTNTRLAVSRDKKTFSSPVIFSTEQDFVRAMAVMRKKIIALRLDNQIKQTIVGLPGVMDKTAGSLFASPNLPRWVGQPVAKRLSQLTDSLTSLYNDSDLAGLGEAHFGAGVGFDIVAYLTISTGVGGSRVVRQELDKMSYGFEPGFMVIDASGQLCPQCHQPTTLEDLVGGANVARRFGCHPQEIKDPKVWDTLARWLSLGLRNVIALWSPDVIVLGGPMMRDIPINKIRQYTPATATFVPQVPAIVLAKHKNDQVFWGALAVINNQ